MGSTPVAAVAAGPAPEEWQEHSDLLELRLPSLDLALVATFLLAGLTMLLPDLAVVAPDLLLLEGLSPARNAVVVLLPLSLMASGLTALALRSGSINASAITLIAGLGVSLVVALRALPPDRTVPWFAVLALLSTALLGRRGGIAVAIAASVLLQLLAGASATVSADAARGAQVLVWVVLGLAWLMTQPLHTALSWSRSSYELALAKTRELQLRQGELARALKGLEEACYRLEAANLELARARQAAEEARKLKARFAAFVSHELRLPLNVITGFSEVMVTSPDSYGGQALPPAYRADVEAVYRAANHLSSLIDDVLDLGAVDAHQMGLQKDWVSLLQILDQASAAAGGLFSNKSLSLALEVPPELPAVYADGTRIKQVILNLLKNAVRFTDSGGARLSASVREGEVVVAVADTGIGIAPDDLPHVFDEFYQSDAAGRRRVGGSGLGLAISKRFVELHGGSMWLESRQGEGTTFYFSLPLCANVAAATLREPWETWARALPLSQPEAGPPVGLLGSDEEAVRVLQRYLEGCQLVPVADLDGVQRVGGDHPFEAVIVTQTQGQEDPRLVSGVRSALPATPVVACSIHTSHSIARDLGVADYLVKPVDRERLARALAPLGEVERVVVVEDDPEMARLLATMVRSLSPRHQVWQALDGDEALALIDLHRPQAVLLDLLMPGSDGFEVLRQLRSDAALRETPVVVITAGGSSQERITAEIGAVSRGAGLTVAELARCLQAVLGALLASPDTPGAHSGALAG